VGARKERKVEFVPIKSQAAYRRILKEIEGLMGAERKTPEGDRLDALVTLVEAWERERFPLGLRDDRNHISGTSWSQ
jgi:HTH-type transcriptional regulator / antitoxin HigA